MDQLQAQYVALKLKARDSLFVHVCLVWDKQRFQEALLLAQQEPTKANGKAFRDGDFMTVYVNYPLDPLQFMLVHSKDHSRDNNRLRRLLYEEFCTQFAELKDKQPAAIAIMKSDEDEPDFFHVDMLSDEFLPFKAPTNARQQQSAT